MLYLYVRMFINYNLYKVWWKLNHADKKIDLQ